MNEKTPRQGFDFINSLSEPAFNVAAMLRCARDTVMRIEDGESSHEVELHAVQRTLALCIEAVEKIGAASADLKTG